MVYAPNRISTPAQSEEDRGSGRIQEIAQQELLGYLDHQVRTVAPAKVDRVDAADNYTYLSAIDEDLPEHPLRRLMILLENSQGNERIVDLVTNNDRFWFITRVIRNSFERQWCIAETWEGDVPF